MTCYYSKKQILLKHVEIVLGCQLLITKKKLVKTCHGCVMNKFVILSNKEHKEEREREGEI